MESMILSVEDKSYSMKIASMTQRSMILVLFEDYCDTKFYHGFMNCYEDEMPVPSMGESYLALLDKLNDIQWTTITDINNLPNLPQHFNRKRIFIEDDGELVIPMETLKNKSLIHINLKDFMDPIEFQSQWRYRIENMGVLLIDNNDQVVENPNGDFRFEITYPLIFNDTDSYKNVHTFSSRHFFCRSIYQDQGIFDENWEENCEVAQEFSEKNYRPSPDGDYVLKFVDPTNVVDMDQLAKLRVDISGTLIPIQSKKKILI